MSDCMTRCGLGKKEAPEVPELSGAPDGPASAAAPRSQAPVWETTGDETLVRTESHVKRVDDQLHALHDEWSSDKDSVRKREYENPNGVGICQGVTMCTWNTLKDWDTRNTIAVDELLEHAQTGDIILFDNETVMGTCLIKCFTRSDFDHVAVVIRFPEPLGVRMLEACAPHAVMDKLGMVAQMVKSGHMYWRQLRKKDGSPLWTNEEENAIRQKALTLVGRPYETDVAQLVQAWSSGEGAWWSKVFGTDCTAECVDYRKSGNRNVTDADHAKALEKAKAEGDQHGETVHHDDPDTEQELFCSELVGAIYRSAGLITSELASFNYLPKDFSTDPHASIELNTDYELLPEKKILHWKLGPDGKEQAEWGDMFSEGGPKDGNAPTGGDGAPKSRPKTFMI